MKGWERKNEDKMLEKVRNNLGQLKIKLLLPSSFAASSLAQMHGCTQQKATFLQSVIDVTRSAFIDHKMCN